MERTNEATVVYMLLHVYDLAKYNIEAKGIGVYSSRQKAQTEAARYMKLGGFRDYPYSCFYVIEYEIDACYWQEGFIARMTPQNISCDIPLWASEEEVHKGERPRQFLKRILAKHGKSEKPKSRFFSEESGALVRYARIITEAKE